MALFPIENMYDISSMRPDLRAGLEAFLPGDPIAVYVTACHFGLLESRETARSELCGAAGARTMRNLSDTYRVQIFIGPYNLSVREKMRDGQFSRITGGRADGCGAGDEHWNVAKEFYTNLVGRGRVHVHR